MSIMDVDEHATPSANSPEPKQPASPAPPCHQPPLEINLIDLINKTFTNNLRILCDKFSLNESLDKQSTCSIWMLNEVLIPLNHYQNTGFDLDGLIALRYLDCENYRTQHVQHQTTCRCFDFDPANEHLSFDLLTQIDPIDLKLTKTHCHCLYAFDHTGRVSCPLVVLPKHDCLETSDVNPQIKSTLSLHESSSGDLDSVQYFIAWLDMFQRQNDDDKPKILLLGVSAMLKLKSLITDTDTFTQLKQRLIDHNVYVLFYPFDTANTLHLDSFNTQWTKNLIELSQRTNPNTDVAFLSLLKQTCRQLVQQFKSHMFNAVIDENRLPFDKFNSSVSDLAQESDTEMRTLTDADIDEYVAWVDEMSRANSLCIKYTYLRDMYNRTKPADLTSKKEVISRDKHWLDFVAKNKHKFKFKFSLGLLSDSDYLSRSLDVDVWRQKYEALVDELGVRKAEMLWNFEVIQFPFNTNSGMLRHPEKDVDRPKNVKPRISVLFAYSASGDYLQPFFVYPTNFADDTADLATNEIYSPNGFVTPRIFAHWLNNFFMPYVNETQPLLLLYCAKLAVVDKGCLASLKEKQVRLLGVCNDTLKPFSFLFTKNMRNRPTDLFLDSWRKITSRLKLSHQFKCKSRQQFFSLFMDTFQNCIEEIGQADLETSLNTSSVSLFRDKMVSTFEQCKLWPVERVAPLVVVESAPKRKRTESERTSRVNGTDGKENGLKESHKAKVPRLPAPVNDLIKDLVSLLVEKSGREEEPDAQFIELDKRDRKSVV